MAKDDDTQLPAERLPTNVAKIRKPWGWDLPTLSKAGAKWLDEWFSRRGLSAAESSARICGPRCTFKSRCPFESLQAPLPIGCPCPVELRLLDMFIERMKTSLGITDNDAWGSMMVEYAGMWKVLLDRAMSEDGSEEVRIESYRGVDKEGNALYEDKVNPTLQFARDVHKILREIGRDLVATQEAKLRLSQTKATMGPEEFLRVVEAKFTVADTDVEDKSEKIRAKRDKPLLEDPDKPRMPNVPHVNTDGLKPE